MTVVKADDGQLLGHPNPAVQQNVQKTVGNFVIIANHRGAALGQLSRVTLQPSGGTVFHQGHPLVGVEPEHTFLLKGDFSVPQGVHHAGIAQDPLPVVHFEDAADVGMALLQQMLGRQIPAAFVVITDHRGTQLRVAAVQEHHGNPGIPQLPVQIQIGIGQGRLGALHDHAPHGMLQQLQEDLALFFKLVVRAVDQCGKAAFQQHLLGVHQQGGKNIAVGEADNDGNGVILGLGLLLQHHGAAALTPLDQPLLCQDLQRVAHRLTADAELLHELLLRWQAAGGCVFPFGDGGPQTVRHLNIFGRHWLSPRNITAVIISYFFQKFNSFLQNLWNPRFSVLGRIVDICI